MNYNTNMLPPNSSSSSSSSSGCFKVRGWYPQGPFYLTEVPFHILQFQFLIVFFVTQSLHHLFFKHCGLPPLVSQLTAGILLSPSLLIRRVEALKAAHELIFPEISNELWQTIGIFGLSLSLYLIAVKMDFTMMRSNGKKPIAIGVLVIVIPWVVNKLLGYTYLIRHLDYSQKVELISSATLLALTTFPVIAILLNDLNLLHSELGRLALSSGIISELVRFYLMLRSKNLAALIQHLINKKEFASRIIGTFCLVMLGIFLVRPLMRLIIRWTPKGRPVNSIYVVLALVFMLMGALIADLFGENVVLGCFIVGAAMPEGPPLASAIVHKFESFIFGMLMPFFITVTVMMADFCKINLKDELLHGQIIMTFTAFAMKIAVCVACSRFYNLAIPDSLALAAIMCSKGITDIATYVMFRQDYNVIHDATFAYLIIVTTITAIVVPIVIKLLYHPLRKYAGYQRRDIMHSKADASLRILACIHRPDNVSSLIKLLSFCGITKENRLIVNVLHLIKLVGRAQPIFISHGLQQRKASSVTYSEDIIWTLKTFHKANMDRLAMHLFTAISPSKAMHEDICTLALDKLVSIIILPFHRKLSIDGSIDFEDHAQRLLNHSILERAPCSVGILIDRGSFRPPTTLARLASSNPRSSKQNELDENDKIMVGVIFIGGDDDREAVAFAKRMALGGKAKKVVVIRIIASGENPCLNVLDSSVLSVLEEDECDPRFHFVQETVTEGSQTACLLKDIAKDFDLIIVGRRYEMDCPQTRGLKQWSEVPELGVLGDLLASPDLHCQTSVLVIQQQRQWTWKGSGLGKVVNA